MIGDMSMNGVAPWFVGSWRYCPRQQQHRSDDHHHRCRQIYASGEGGDEPPLVHISNVTLCGRFGAIAAAEPGVWPPLLDGGGGSLVMVIYCGSDDDVVGFKWRMNDASSSKRQAALCSTTMQ